MTGSAQTDADNIFAPGLQAEGAVKRGDAVDFAQGHAAGTAEIGYGVLGEIPARCLYVLQGRDKRAFTALYFFMNPSMVERLNDSIAFLYISCLLQKLFIGFVDRLLYHGNQLRGKGEEPFLHFQKILHWFAILYRLGNFYFIVLNLIEREIAGPHCHQACLDGQFRIKHPPGGARSENQDKSVPVSSQALLDFFYQVKGIARACGGNIREAAFSNCFGYIFSL